MARCRAQDGSKGAPCGDTRGPLLFMSKTPALVGDSEGHHMVNRRFVLACAAIFVFALAWNGLVHLVILRSVDEVLNGIGRPAVERNLGLSLLSMMALAVLFVVSYVRSARDGSVREGVLHGILFGLLAGVLVDLNQYVLYPIPASLALSWFGFGTIEFCIYGVLASRLCPPERVMPWAS